MFHLASVNISHNQSGYGMTLGKNDQMFRNVITGKAAFDHKKPFTIQGWPMPDKTASMEYFFAGLKPGNLSGICVSLCSKNDIVSCIMVGNAVLHRD